MRERERRTGKIVERDGRREKEGGEGGEIKKNRWSKREGGMKR